MWRLWSIMISGYDCVRRRQIMDAWNKRHYDHYSAGTPPKPLTRLLMKLSCWSLEPHLRPPRRWAMTEKCCRRRGITNTCRLHRHQPLHTSVAFSFVRSPRAVCRWFELPFHQPLDVFLQPFAYVSRLEHTVCFLLYTQAIPVNTAVTPPTPHGGNPL